MIIETEFPYMPVNDEYISLKDTPIKNISFVPISTENEITFRTHIPLKYHSCLNSALQGDQRFIITGAFLDGSFAGYVIVLPSSQYQENGVVFHLNVLTTNHSLNVAKQLLFGVEDAARKAKYTRLEMIMEMEDKPELLNLFRIKQKMFESCFWEKLEKKYSTFFIHDPEIKKEYWYTLDMPKTFELFPWNELRSEESEQIRMLSQKYSSSAINFLDPSIIELVEMHTSLGVRNYKDGKIAGWLVNEYVSEKVVVFRRLFILPEYRNSNLFYSLLSNSIERAFEHYQYAKFSVEEKNSKMVHVVKRMMGKLFDTVTMVYYSKKELY